VNRRVVEALIRAGAFDAIDTRRATLFASVGVALAEAERSSLVTDGELVDVVPDLLVV